MTMSKYIIPGLTESTFNKAIKKAQDQITKETNKSKVMQAAKKSGLTLSYYNPLLDEMSKAQIKRITTAIGYGDYTDLKFRIKEKTYYVEVTPGCGVNDDELDLVFLTAAEYSRYQ